MAETRRDTLGRHRTAAKHTHKLTDEQVAKIRANRVIAEAPRDALRVQRTQSEQRKQMEASEESETAHEELCELFADETWEELSRLMHDELEDPFDHMKLGMNTTAPSANLSSEHEHEHEQVLAAQHFLQLHQPLAIVPAPFTAVCRLGRSLPRMVDRRLP